MSAEAPAAPTPSPVVLAGRWETSERLVWSATAASPRPIVAVSFVICDGIAHWTKSTRLAADSVAVRLALGVDPADRARVIVACGAAAPPVRLATADWRPCLPDLITIETGVVTRLCRFDSAPPVEIAVLFLATADVRFGRNRLWRLPPARAATFEEPLRGLLAGARAGSGAWPSEPKA